MPANAYVGIDNLARKVKSIYIGIDGIARKVKNGFIGISGIARKFFSSAVVPDVSNVGEVNITSAQTKSLGRPAKTANHLIYGPGDENSSASFSFTDDLVSTQYVYQNRISVPNSSEFQGYAFFMGGINIDPYDRTYNSTYTYNDDLVAQARTVLPVQTLSNDMYKGAYAIFNNTLLFANWDSTGSWKYDYGPFQIQFNSDFVLSQTSYPIIKEYCNAASTTDYWYSIGGQRGNTNLNSVDVINKDLVHSSTTTLNAGYGCSTMAINGLACRLCYNTDKSASSVYDTVDAFDNDKIRSNPFTLGFTPNYTGLTPYLSIDNTAFIKGENFIYSLDSDFIKTTYNYTLPKSGDYQYSDSDTCHVQQSPNAIYSLGRTNNNILFKGHFGVSGLSGLFTIPIN